MIGQHVSKTRILLADDHAYLEGGLRLLLNGSRSCKWWASGYGVKVLSLVEDTRPIWWRSNLTVRGWVGWTCCAR